MKLSTKLTLLIITLALVPLIVLGNLAYENGRQTIERQTNHQLTSISALRESEFNRWVNDNTRTLRALAQRPLVREYTAVQTRSGITSQDPDFRSAQSTMLADHLVPAVEQRGGFLDFAILGLDGQILTATDRELEGKIRSGLAYFKEGMEGTYVDGVIFNLSENQYNMHISTPILDDAGRTIAVLVGHADLEDMASIINQKSGGSASENNYLVSAYNFFITDPSDGEGFALTTSVYSEGVENCLAGNTGTAVYDNYQDMLVLGAYRWMPDYEMCMLTEVDYIEAFDSIEKYRATMFSMISVIAIIAVFLGFIVSYTVSEPIRELVEGSLEFGNGNLDYRINIKGNDEMSALAQSFNQMASSLRLITTSRDNLDEEIFSRKKVQGELNIKDFAFESSSSADSIGSNEGILTHANPAFARIWGYKNVDEVIGKPILDFLADKEKAIEIVDSITNTGKWAGEYEALKKDGSTFIAMSYANVIKDAGGKQTALYSSVVDVTERKAAEREIQKLNEELEERVLLRTSQLEEANKELESFAYSVSHDLRAPLRAIDGFSRILLDDHSAKLPAGSQRYLELIRNNTHDMETLIDDLLAFSRLANQAPDREIISPNKIVKCVLEDLAGEMDGRQIELIVADMPETKADPSLIKQVYLNLIDNAFKFTRGKEPAQIEIGCLEQGGEQIYFVKDNGVGFDMQYKDNLFGVFQRLHRAEDFEGTGVGLAIVLRIIRRHGGRIWAEAGVDQGAAFYFVLEGSNQKD